MAIFQNGLMFNMAVIKEIPIPFNLCIICAEIFALMFKHN